MNNITIAFLAASTLILASCSKSMSAESNSPGVPSTPGQAGGGGSTGGGGTQEPSTPPPLAVQPFPEDARKFDQPWDRHDTSIVIDAYEGNGMDWDKMEQDHRVAAIIHRSTYGLTVDSKYVARRAIAKQRGYLWGAYHLGRSGDPIAQAKKFLQVAGDDKDTLLFLDLEDTSNSGMMNIPNAVLFMSYVFSQTGKLPVVYANHSVTVALNVALKGNSLFIKTRLWYARFRSNIPDFPEGLWPSYFLWQFSSEINCSATGRCLYNVPGTSFDMDINVFYGTKEALAAQWAL